ncbi:MAG: glycosyltransferase [Phycisphaeraceae bacterium]|nr:glycosyltransferase [Phycisphaeraceae bacterium]
MRIFHISTRLILGGSQENTVLSCEGQAMRGHEVHLAFGPIYGPEGSLLERVERFNRAHADNPIRTHIVPHLVREVRPTADARALRELRRLVLELGPDVVHTHSSKAGVLGRIAAWREGGRAGRIRVVHTIHGPPFMPVEGGAAARANVRLNNVLYTIAERFAARRCHTIISVADAMTRQFLSRGIGRDEQYVTVASGMETEPFLNAAPGEDRASVRARLGLCGDDFVIGTVARLAQHKGHDDLLDALADDLRTHPRWKLLWVGDGWWRDRLIAKARAFGIAVRTIDDAAAPSGPRPTNAPPPTPDAAAQLIITGLVPPERIPGLMRAMDVLAHPSYREGLPRTVPQALLAGVCPIAYDCDGTPEVVREGETGFLVPTGDRAALRAAVLRAAANPADRTAMAARGRDECARRFDVGRMIDALQAVYEGRTPGEEARP